MSELDIVVVPFRQKIRGTLKKHGIRLGHFLEKIAHYVQDIVTYIG